VSRDLDNVGTGPRTECLLERTDNGLRVRIDAVDPDMSQLIATWSDAGTDRFLYEEDCVQIAFVLPDFSVPTQLLVNALGTRSGRRTTGLERKRPPSKVLGQARTWTAIPGG